MSDIKIYHNPRCSKSRAAVKLVNDQNISVDIVEYLKNPLTTDELKDVLGKLNMDAEALMRKGEADYKEHVKGKNLSEEEKIQAMIDFPKLIERPIVIKGDKAVVARPTERIKEVL